VKAEDAVAALEAIRTDHGGELTPEAVVEHAQARTSPLHRLFEWDDTEAARRFRLDQARLLLRSYTIVYETRRETVIEVRGFQQVTNPQHERVYVPTLEALRVPEYRDQILDAARRELETWTRKYQECQALAATVAGVKRLLDTTLPGGA
jgi:hypothetical protein